MAQNLLASSKTTNGMEKAKKYILMARRSKDFLKMESATAREFKLKKAKSRTMANTKMVNATDKDVRPIKKGTTTRDSLWTARETALALTHSVVEISMLVSGKMAKNMVKVFRLKQTERSLKVIM